MGCVIEPGQASQPVDQHIKDHCLVVNETSNKFSSDGYRMCLLINTTNCAVLHSLRLQPLAAAGATNGTVEILMENDPGLRHILPIHLDINQIEIKSVAIAVLEGSDHLHNIEFTQTIKKDGKLLELELPLETLVITGPLKLSVVIDFVSQITKTLQGIYKVDYKDDFGAKEE